MKTIVHLDKFVAVIVSPKKLRENEHLSRVLLCNNT